MPKRSKLELPPIDLGEELLPERLARLRKERGLTQVQLAADMGITQTLVSDYERGKIRPHPEMLARFALALGVSTDEILGLKAPTKNGARVGDRKWARRVQLIKQLPRRDQAALLRTVDAFLSKADAG